MQRLTVPGALGGVDGDVHFTFSAGALAAMTRKTGSTAVEDNQNV